MSIYKKASFLISAADIKQLPQDQGIEIAVVGRSNAGKSSVLNCITQNKKLARVSKTPGRTQLINVFELDETRRLIDLPGYGFADVPKREKIRWEKMLNSYFEERQCLQGLLLIMDIRHPFKPLDMTMLDYCQHRALPVHVLLNKADKLSNNAVKKTIYDATPILKAYDGLVTLQGFSALRNNGTKELYTVLDKWYELNN